MSTLNSHGLWARLGGLWLVRVHIPSPRLTLAVPLPLYVFVDALLAVGELGEIILPRLGLPNWPALAGQLLARITPPDGAPLVDVRAKGVSVSVRRVL